MVNSMTKWCPHREGPFLSRRSASPGPAKADAAVPFEAQALAFLEGQFNGAAAPNGCASIGQGNSLAPLPQPAS